MSTGWTRKRALFLGISAALLLALLLAVREVLLPFVLAVIVAYVLTPLVAFCERYRVPRAAAILLVYASTGTLLYAGAAAVAPRIYQEALQLKREVPELTRQLLTTWAPTAEARLDAFRGRTSPEENEKEVLPVLEIHPAPGGGYGVEFNGPLEIEREDADHYRIVAGRSSTTSFDVSALIQDAIEQTIEYTKRNAFELLRMGKAIVSSTSRAVILTFMTLMCAGYLMHTRDDIFAFIRSLPPESSRSSLDRLLRRIDRGLAGVVRGQLIICLVNGVLSAIGFVILDLKYWPILAIIAGAMSIIPIFGSILSTVPAVLVGLTQDFWIAVWVLVWILLIHQIEANLLNPKIIGVSAKLHPVLVVFSLITGEHFFGLWGALLAVPALSLVHSVFTHLRFELLPDAGPDSLPPLVALKPRD